MLEAKFLPCKEGEGSEPGPNLCLCSAAMFWLCRERLELCWNPVGTWSPCSPAHCWEHTVHTCQLPLCSLMEQSMQQWIKIGPFFQGQKGGLSQFCRASTVPGQQPRSQWPDQLCSLASPDAGPYRSPDTEPTMIAPQEGPCPAGLRAP